MFCIVCSTLHSETMWIMLFGMLSAIIRNVFTFSLHISLWCPRSENNPVMHIKSANQMTRMLASKSKRLRSPLETFFLRVCICSVHIHLLSVQASAQCAFNCSVCVQLLSARASAQCASVCSVHKRLLSVRVCSVHMRLLTVDRCRWNSRVDM